MTFETMLFIGVLVEFVAILILIGVIIHLSNTDSAAPTESEQKIKEFIAEMADIVMENTYRQLEGVVKEAKKSTNQEATKMSYKVKPFKHEFAIPFTFEHDGEEYTMKVMEHEVHQVILDEFVEPEGREAVDKFLKENDLWDETIEKLGTFLNEHFEEEFHREVRKW